MVTRIADLFILAPVAFTVPLLPQKLVVPVAAVARLQYVYGVWVVSLRVAAVMVIEPVVVRPPLKLVIKKWRTPLAVVLRLVVVWYFT